MAALKFLIKYSRNSGESKPTSPLPLHPSEESIANIDLYLKNSG